MNAKKIISGILSAALEPYARAESEEDRQRIAQEVAEALNEA